MWSVKVKIWTPSSQQQTSELFRFQKAVRMARQRLEAIMAIKARPWINVLIQIERSVLSNKNLTTVTASFVNGNMTRSALKLLRKWTNNGVVHKIAKTRMNYCLLLLNCGCPFFEKANSVSDCLLPLPDNAKKCCTSCVSLRHSSPSDACAHRAAQT